jgi:hypothetical protein
LLLLLLPLLLLLLLFRLRLWLLFFRRRLLPPAALLLVLHFCLLVARGVPKGRGQFFNSKLQAQVCVRFKALAAPTRHWGDAHPGVEVEASAALAHYFPEVFVVLEGSPDAVENGSSSPEREPGTHAMPNLDASQFFKVIFFSQTSNAVAAEARSLQAVNLRGHLQVWLAGWLAGWQTGRDDEQRSGDGRATRTKTRQRKEKKFDVCKSVCHSVD